MQGELKPVEARGRTARRPKRRPIASIAHTFDDLDLPAFIRIAAAFGQERFGFVVTPNVDHMIRCHEDESFRLIYAQASFVLLDSRFANKLFRIFKNREFPVCTGSDLTLELFQRVINPADPIVLIGGDPARARELGNAFGLINLRHYNPPMGFITNPEEVERCLQFVEQNSPFRFCFFAFGTPQQEDLAARLRERGAARGLLLCVGAAVNFVTGVEKRAPKWIRDLALEWLYRLIRNPRRMAHRYLIRGPRIFRYLLKSSVESRVHRVDGVSTGVNAAADTAPAGVGQPVTLK